MLRPSLRANDFLVAESAAMRVVLAAIETFADGGAPVLVTGEHGTGRELVARVLHQRGPRGRHTFLAVSPSFEDIPHRPDDDDCARVRRALHAAKGGTLVVKDLSDLSRASQHTLARALRDGDDVQVIGGADLDIDHAVTAEIVTRELFDRFAARRIVVPPLRDRLEDLPALFERWVKHYATEIGRPKPTVSTRAHERLRAYPWPGNAGELKSIARRLVVRVTGKIEASDVDEILPIVAERVPLEDLAFEDMVKSKLAKLLDQLDGYPVEDLYAMVVARVERPLFELVLARTGGNQIKAAALLGINRSTLRKKLTAGADRSPAARDRRASSRR
ncbi:MAG: sigma 54-interacting transcriptional regulator [Proteobacteria bacterium]|nr:sigma 54-interacting transcriptional regulator [Pseudomonadota bacterium]